MIFADAPPAIIAPIEVRFAIAVYGDVKALTGLKEDIDRRGATTSWATSGAPKVHSLFIAVDGPKPTTENQAFIDAVNRKEFGNLSAGFAEIGAGK